jgi:rhamnosyltransferase
MEGEFKFSAVVVTYYPQVEELIVNIKKFIDFVDKLIIWENTPITDRKIYHVLLPEYNDKIIFLGTNKNEGIAYALNRSTEWSIENEFSHMLTMDQDSLWDNFEFFKLQILKYSINPGIGIFAPVIYEQHKNHLPEMTIVKDAITSGSVYNLKMINEIGGFREDFFIDAVDLEFCYWANRNGFKTIVLGDSYLKQKYGNVSVHKFLSRTYQTLNYSAARLFYIVRNHIFLWKEYPELSRFQKKRILRVYILGRLKEVCMFEKDKFGKIFSVFRGILYGISGIGEHKRSGAVQKKL